MKRLLLLIGFISLSSFANAVTNASVSISSGTGFYGVDVSSLSTNYVRQNVVIADPNTTAGVAPVNAFTGLTVNLATSTLTNSTNDALRVQSKSSGLTGSTVPSTATYVAGNGSGNLTGLITCDSFVQISTYTAGHQQYVALSSGKSIYVCHYNVVSASATIVTLEYGTGTNCASGTTSMAGPYNFTANSGISAGSGIGAITKTAASNALCINNSAAAPLGGVIAYTQY